MEGESEAIQAPGSRAVQVLTGHMIVRTVTGTFEAHAVIAERDRTPQVHTALIQCNPVRAITIFQHCQRCVPLGCTVPFRDDCVSFKCPCHGSHYHVTGEYLDGPAPRSLDRFALSFNGENVLVDTGTLNNMVPHPDTTTLLIQVPNVSCSA